MSVNTDKRCIVATVELRVKHDLLKVILSPFFLEAVCHVFMGAINITHHPQNQNLSEFIKYVKESILIIAI